MSERNVIIVRESVMESVVSDGTTFLMLMTVIIVAYFTHVPAIGWLGALMLFIGFFVRIGHRKEVMTIAEARRELDRIEDNLHPSLSTPYQD